MKRKRRERTERVSVIRRGFVRPRSCIVRRGPAGPAGLVFAFSLLLALASSARGAAPFPVIGKPAPEFTLTSQSGQQIRLSQFRGKLVLVNFIYTHCTDVCPLTTGALMLVQRRLMERGWWAKDVVFISITTDPARDTPAVLKQYARRYRADPAGWHFLTADLKTLTRVYRQYGIEIQPREKGLQDHLLPTFVIDRKGTVLGAYPPNPDPQDVVSDLEKLR